MGWKSLSLGFGWEIEIYLSPDFEGDGWSLRRWPQILMAPEKVAPDLESTRISVQGMRIRKITFPGYAMRGYYTLDPLAYGVHHKCAQLVCIIGDLLDKHVSNDVYHGTGLIHL